MNRTNSPQDDHVTEQQALPQWSAYLQRLGGQVKKVANTPVWTANTAATAESAASSPQYRPRNPSGDRRMSAEQRRKNLADVLPNEVGSDTLSSPVWRGLFTEKKDRRALGGDGAVSRPKPIGDRRTRVRQRRSRTDVPQPKKSWFSLGIWSYYFIAKLGMVGMGLIAFHALENLAFAALILLPVNYLRRVKGVITAVLALALLYYDSWLPPVDRLISQASLVSDFSLPYLFELLMRFVSWQVMGMLLVAMISVWYFSRWLRADMLALAGMLSLTVFQDLSGGAGAQLPVPDMDKVMQEFFAKEAQRSVLFSTPAADAVPFDVIFVHVCSLAWDDVLAVGLDQHPIWNRFDILMTHFNSAASYSGPAAIHLMRAKCGQPEHGSMYQPTADKCYLMNSLQLSGFEQNVVLNHDGKFDDFLGQLKTHGRLTEPPMSLDGLTPAQFAFDKSPVYDDLSVLSRWLDNRASSGGARVAMYYNTVSMHDGNYQPGAHSSARTLDSYKLRLGRFLDELDSFMQKLDQSERRAVVVMVPEHGAAVRGDKRQIAGLREIPTPAITIVPVGIRVLGGNIKHDGSALVIDQPTSYLAISNIVERMIEKSPYTADKVQTADYIADLRVTPFVAQSEKTTVAEYGGRYYLGHGGKWEAYTEFNAADNK